MRKKINGIITGLLVVMVLLSGCGNNIKNIDIEPVENVENTVDTTEEQTTEETTEELSEEDIINQKIEDRISTMSMEDKVSQMIFAHIVNGAVEVSQYNLGGVILFADAFENRDSASIKEYINNYQNAANVPMLIGIDEEGGTVVRVSKFTAYRDNRFLSPQELYSKGGMEAIASDTLDKSRFLLDLGINVNLAPVCDVSTNSNDFINARAFGQNGTETAKYVDTVVSNMKSSSIGSTLKHFPGYGNNVDTHTGIAIDSRPYETFVSDDFLPFKAGITAGADSILVSHNIVNSIEEGVPASISPNAHNILREDLGFNGVIMTDDMGMDAMLEYGSEEDTAVLAVEAGNDMIITTDYNVQRQAIIAAVNSGRITEDRINESVRRIFKWKYNIGIMK